MATEEVLWLRKMTTELDIVNKNAATKLYSDNQSAIRLGKNEKVAERTRYMKVKAAFVREQIEEKLMSLEYVKGENQLADILTKPTLIKKFTENRNKLMVSRSSLLNMLMIAMSMIAIISNIECHNILERVNPIIWTSVDDKVLLSEVRRVKIVWAVSNPCETLAVDGDQFDRGEHIKRQLGQMFRLNLYGECNKLWNDGWVKEVEKLTIKTDPSRKSQVLDQIYPSRTKRESISITAVVIVVTSVVGVIKTWLFGDEREARLRNIESELETFESDVQNIKRVADKLVEAVVKVDRKIIQLRDDIQEQGDLLILFYKVCQAMAEMKHKINRVIELKAHGKVATWELFQLTGVEDLKLVDVEDTVFESAEVNEKVITLNVLLLMKAKDTRIYKANTFQYYGNLSETPTLNQYTGTQYAIYNETSHCLSQIELTSSRWIQSNCSETDYNDEYANQWTTLKTINSFTELKPINQHFKTLINSYVYCFPANITISGKSYVCPPYVFKLPIDVSYKTGKLVHDTSFKVINVTGSQLIIDRLDAGLFRESKINHEQQEMIKNSIELKQLNSEMMREKLVIRRDAVYAGVSLGTVMLLIVLGYAFYKLWKRYKRSRPINSNTIQQEHELEQYPTPYPARRESANNQSHQSALPYEESLSRVYPEINYQVTNQQIQKMNNMPNLRRRGGRANDKKIDEKEEAPRRLQAARRSRPFIKTRLSRSPERSIKVSTQEGSLDRIKADMNALKDKVNTITQIVCKDRLQTLNAEIKKMQENVEKITELLKD